MFPYVSQVNLNCFFFNELVLVKRKVSVLYHPYNYQSDNSYVLM